MFFLDPFGVCGVIREMPEAVVFVCVRCGVCRVVGTREWFDIKDLM